MRQCISGGFLWGARRFFYASEGTLGCGFSALGIPRLSLACFLLMAMSPHEIGVAAVICSFDP
jgi:hypothetical protein